MTDVGDRTYAQTQSVQLIEQNQGDLPTMSETNPLIRADQPPTTALLESRIALSENWRLSRFGGTDPAAPLRAACAAAVADLDIASVYASSWISPVGDIQYGKGTLIKRLPDTPATRPGSRGTRVGGGPR